MALGLMPGEDDWLRRLMGGGGPFSASPSASPAQGTIGGGIFGKLAGKLNEGVTKMQTDPLAQLGLRVLSNSGYSPQKRGLGEILGSSVLQNQQANQETAQNDLQRRYMEAQIGAMGRPKERKPIAVMGPDGKPTYVDEQDAIGKSPVSSPTQIDDGIGNFNPGDYTPASFAKFIKSRDPNDLKRYETPREQNPYFRDVTRTNPDGSTTQGVFDARAGSYSWPNPVVPPGKKKEVDAEATARGQATGQAQFDLPRIEQNVNESIAVIDKLKAHPGLQYITGLSSKVPIVPGTPQAGADALAKQVQGQAFLQAFNTLKGGGAITEMEGAKAEAAIARLQRAQGTKDYQAALDDLKGVLNSGLERARKQAGAASPKPSAPAGKRSLEDLLKKYGS